MAETKNVNVNTEVKDTTPKTETPTTPVVPSAKKGKLIARARNLVYISDGKYGYTRNASRYIGVKIGAEVEF